MIKRLSPVLAGLAALGLLAACSAPTPTTSPTPATSVAPTHTTSPTVPSPAPAGAAHLTSDGARLVGTGTIQTAPITPRRKTTVLVGVSTLTAGSLPAPVPSLTGGGVRWTQLGSVTKVENGVGSSRRLTVFASAEVGSGPLTISVPAQRKQDVSWSVVESMGTVAQMGSTDTALAGPPAQVSLPRPPTGTVVAFFLVGTGSSINAEAPATKLGQGDTPAFPSSTSTQVSGAQTVQLTWTPDGPGHYLGLIVEMSA